MRNKLLVILLLMSVQLVVNAQKKKPDELGAGDRLVRFNFTGLIDPLETNLSGGIEYKKTKQLSYIVDMGYIFYSGILSNVKRTNGVILRTAVRYYSKNTPQLFGELELHNKLVFYKMQDWLGKDVVNGVASYEQLQYFTYSKYVAGVNLKTGYQAWMTRDGKWWMEAFMGIGLKFRNYFLVGQPGGTVYANPSGSFIFGNNGRNRPGGIVLPNFSFGLRLGYKLKVSPAG